MANRAPRTSAQIAHETPPRLRLAANVVCLYNELRPPVVQAAGRRGRYPANVTRLSSIPRLRVGAVCDIYTTPSDINHGRIVRLVQALPNGDWLIESIDGVDIHYGAGGKGRCAGVRASMLRRTFIGENHV